MASRRRVPAVLQLRITLAETNPPVWRRVLVHSDTTLHGLHRLIQFMFEWLDYHLYEFTIRGERYEAPLPEAEGADSTRVTLGDLAMRKGEQFTYLYDLGDHWVHQIVVEERRRPSPHAWLPWLVDGERAGPPEDCGGVDRFAEFLEALVDPDDPEHEEWRAWVGEDYDPDAFFVRTVRHALLLAGTGEMEAGEDR